MSIEHIEVGKIYVFDWSWKRDGKTTNVRFEGKVLEITSDKKFFRATNVPRNYDEWLSIDGVKTASEVIRKQEEPEPEPEIVLPEVGLQYTFHSNLHDYDVYQGKVVRISDSKKRVEIIKSYKPNWWTKYDAKQWIKLSSYDWTLDPKEPVITETWKKPHKGKVFFFSLAKTGIIWVTIYFARDIVRLIGG